jgi:hypothetical protein
MPYPFLVVDLIAQVCKYIMNNKVLTNSGVKKMIQWVILTIRS